MRRSQPTGNISLDLLEVLEILLTRSIVYSENNLSKFSTTHLLEHFVNFDEISIFKYQRKSSQNTRIQNGYELNRKTMEMKNNSDDLEGASKVDAEAESDHQFDFTQKSSPSNCELNEMGAKILLLAAFELSALVAMSKRAKAEHRNKKRKNFTKEAILNCLRKNRFICRFCPKRLTSGKTCKKHKPRSKMVFECDFCNRNFERKSTLDAHARSVHRELVELEGKTCDADKGLLPKNEKTNDILRLFTRIR